MLKVINNPLPPPPFSQTENGGVGKTTHLNSFYILDFPRFSGGWEKAKPLTGFTWS
jgi:hypothetical protein